MMSQARCDMLLSGVTSAARKVYGAVPIADSWTAQQVAAELARTGISQDFRLVSGCLDSLVRSGLIRESGKGAFCREPIRPTLEPHPPKEPAMPKLPAAAKTTIVAAAPSPLLRLEQLATRVNGLAQALREIGDELADTVIDIETQREHNDADLAKLKQLQQLLKSLG